MVYLLILLSSKSIFSFCTKKQKSCWYVPCTGQPLHHILKERATCFGGWNLNSAASLDLSQRFFFLGGACVMVQRGLAWNCYSFLSFVSFFFFFRLCVGHAKIYICPSIYFFFWFSLSFLICIFFFYIDYFKFDFYFLFHS